MVQALTEAGKNYKRGVARFLAGDDDEMYNSIIRSNKLSAITSRWEESRKAPVEERKRPVVDKIRTNIKERFTEAQSLAYERQKRRYVRRGMVIRGLSRQEAEKDFDDWFLGITAGIRRRAG